MQSIESEGDTIDQAIEKALQVLKLERDRVEIEILSDATRGLFGFGGKPARVRAVIRAPLSAAPSTARLPQSVSRETAGDLPPNRVSRETGSDAPSNRSETGPTSRPDTAAAPTLAVADATVEKSRHALEELLVHLGVSCRVEVGRSDEPDKIVLAVTGDSGGLLIGRRGQTLDAIEHVINRIAGRSEDGAPSRIVIDVERYRERRQEYLDALARRLAEKAKHTRRVITLNPMSPRDRRIVHLALQSDPGIETRSQGEGQFRKVLILPVEGARGGGRSNRANRSVD
jgi:spoIIIJ-associated protein